MSGKADSAPFTALVLGGGESLLREVSDALQAHPGSRVESVPGWEEAVHSALNRAPELLVLDADRLGSESVGVLERLRSLRQEAVILAITTDPSVGAAVQAIKGGADEYLSLPADRNRLRLLVKEALDAWQLHHKGRDLYQRQRRRYDFGNIIGESPPIRRVFGLMRKVIPSPTATVLIRGETGTGKGLIARAIHYNAYNGTGGGNSPYVEINCTAIPDTLLESELFGYERGAFTDAKSQKKGLLELANGGALFLDEIGHMNLTLQMKLMKVIEEKCFRRLGGIEDIQVRLRILAGTNRNLEEALREGTFREDLYYRLNVVTIDLPPLRERGEDVLLLADHFVRHFAREHNRQVRTISPRARRLLLDYHWPGNIRELKNAIERAVLLGEGETILPEHLPLDLGPPAVRADREAKPPARTVIEIPREGIPLRDAERLIAERLLALNEGNKSKTARMLGISRPRLARILRRPLPSSSSPLSP